MGELVNREDWSFSTMCWYAVFIWFGASLFSQSLYMALNGTPYEANQLLGSIGPYAWVIIGIELVVWAFVAFAVGRKVVNRFQVSTHEIATSDQITPQA